jgi:HEPN domain-containing protein
LVLEKVLKALWIQDNVSNEPPKIHNLLKISSQTTTQFSEQQLEYFAEMNQFNSKGRYPEYAMELEKMVTFELSEPYIKELKIQVIWIQNLMHNI